MVGSLLLSVVTGLCCGCAALILFAIPVLGLIAVAAGACVPLASRSRKRRMEQRQLREELPVLLDRLAAGIQAGQSLPAAFVEAALATQGRLAAALAAAAADVRATGDLNDALKASARALQDQMVDRVFLTVRAVAEIAGSSAPTLLHAAAAHLRADLSAQAEVDAKRSWVTASAGVAVSAPWITVAVLTLHADAANAYRSRAGGYVLVVTAVLCVVGYAAMRIIARSSKTPRVVR